MSNGTIQTKSRTWHQELYKEQYHCLRDSLIEYLQKIISLMFSRSFVIDFKTVVAYVLLLPGINTLYENIYFPGSGKVPLRSWTEIFDLSHDPTSVFWLAGIRKFTPPLVREWLIASQINVLL